MRRVRAKIRRCRASKWTKNRAGSHPAQLANRALSLLAALLLSSGVQAAAPRVSNPDVSPEHRDIPILEEITVTGSRTGSALAEIPTAVSTLDTNDIRQQFGLSTDILKAIDVRVPGLNVSTGGRSQCLTNIRGRTPSFQINGVPANQELRPSNCNSAFQLSPYAIDRVEVLRGATALFGAGAPGGIVNIQTRQAESEAMAVDLVVQSGANTDKTSKTLATDVYAGVGQRFERFDYYVGVGYQDYGAARDPHGDLIPATEFESLAFNTSLGWALSDTARVRLTGTWFEEDPGQEYNVDGVEVDAGVAFPTVIAVQDNPFRRQSFDRQMTLAGSLELDEIFGHQLVSSVFYQEQEFRQRANFQDFNAGAPDFFNDNRENSTLGLRLTLARDVDFAAGSFGIEYGADVQRSEFIRLLLDTDNPAVVTGFIAPEVVLDTTGLFLQSSFTRGAVRLSGGVRQEYYRGEIGTRLAGRGLSGQGEPGDFNDAQLTLWNAGVIYDVTAAFQLYASFNQGAELTQLGRAARRASDPSLIDPEPAVSDQYEVGGRGLLGPAEVTFAAFRSESDAASLVQPDPSCAGQSFCPLIPLRVPQKVWGFEATFAWDISDAWTVGALFTWQEGEIFSEDLGEFIPFGADTVSPTRMTAYADWHVNERLSFGVQGTYVAKTHFFSASEQDFGLIDTDDVFLADASMTIDAGPGRISVGISNLFNESYENVTLAAGGFTPTLAEGRRVTIGYTMKR